MSKILITGGHLTPALAFIDYLKAAHPKEEVIFAGREYAQLDNGQPAWERSEITQRGLPFIPFQAQKSSNFNPFTYAETIRQAKTVLTANNVDLVLSFGGFMALPFALAAHQLKIPVITHEQTRVLGRANRALTLLANTTALSYSDTLLPFWTRHTQVTGNPLRAQLWQSAPAPAWFSPTTSLPILLVCGGSQGAQALNQLLLPILAPLSQDFIIVHQVGTASQARNPLAEINAFLNQNFTTITNYFPREFLKLKELAFFYQNASLVVARAGANTVAELTAFRLPTLFVPLPHANYDEQYQNAAALAAQDAALVVRQEELQPSDLLNYINELAAKAETLHQNLAAIDTQKDATHKLYKCIQEALTKAAPTKKAVTPPPVTQNATKSAPVDSTPPVLEKSKDAQPTPSSPVSASQDIKSEQPVTNATTSIPVPSLPEKTTHKALMPQSKISLLALDKKENVTASIPTPFVKTENRDEDNS